MSESKTLGAAIDEIVGALKFLPEASRSVAIRAACEALGIAVPPLVAGAVQPGALGAVTAIASVRADESPPQAHDIRSFKEQKDPTSATEMACVIAYYLQRLAPETERKSVVNTDDIEKYFIQGNFPLPKRIQQLLPDAKSAGYFDSTDRGTYQLNAVGHNLVAHGLPRGPKASATVKTKSKPLKKSSIKKHKTKRR